MKKTILLILAAFALAMPALAQISAVPAAMNFQGRLAKPDGTPVADGTYNVQFSVYTAATGGTLLWQRSVTGIAVKNGTFATRLDFSGGYQNSATQASLFAASNVFLDLSINGGASLVPRQSFVSVAYAMKADSVKDGAITNASVANGTLTASKFVGGILPPGGAAGGSLTGTYPNPGIANNVITSNQLALDPNSLAYVTGAYANFADTFYNDILNVTYNNNAASFGWQSFTPKLDGYLRYLGIICGTTSGSPLNTTLSIYNGEGTAGTRIFTQTVTVTGTLTLQNFTLMTPPNLVAGTKYTWYLGNATGLKVGYQSTDVYPGGRSDISATYDYAFTTYVSPDPSRNVFDVSIAGSFNGLTSSSDYDDGITASTTRAGKAGVYAYNNGVTGAYAGLFYGPVQINGNLQVVGTLSKSAGSFKIDHPLDPANKTLSHSFVESPDMMNIYNGNITTDAKGRATVTLPKWFSALNRDYRYGLTVIGEFAQAIVEKEIMGNHFVIRTNKPRVKVSWQVTGIRNDAYAKARRIPVEEEKSRESRGTYLFPDGFAPAKIGKK